MKFERLGYLLFSLLVITSMLVFLFVQNRTTDIYIHDRFIDTLLQLEQEVNELDQNTLKVISFQLNQYDPLVDNITIIRSRIEELKSSEVGLYRQISTDIDQLVDAYHSALNKKMRIMERIKTHAALVRNSLHYLPIAVSNFHSSHFETGDKLYELLHDQLRYNLLPSHTEAQRLKKELESLGKVELPPGKRALLDNALLHMRANLKDMTRLSSLRDKYLSVPNKQLFDDLYTTYAAYYAHQSRIAKYFSWALLLTIIVLFVSLWHAIRRMLKARHAAQRAWKQLHDALESLSEAFALFDTKGQLVLRNKKFTEFYPWLSEQLTPGVALYTLEKLSQERKSLLTSDEQAETIPHFSTPVPEADGSSYLQHLADGRWYQASDTKTSAGEMACVRVDVTENMLAAEKVRKLSRAVEQSPATVVITNDNGTIEYVNPRFEETTGYTAEEAIGQNPRFLKSGDKTQEEYRELWHTIKSGKTWRGEFQNRRKDGSLYFEAASISAVRNHTGNITHFIAVKEDISEHKKAEQILRRSQKMDAVGQLTGGIAHDFNNILAVILGNVELLKMQIPNDEKIQGRIDTIDKSAQRAATLTSQLLGFSRRQVKLTEKTDINLLIQGIDKLITHSITPEVETKYQFANDLWLVDIDPGDLEDALLNLAINAHDAMSGSGRLTLRTSNKVLDSPYCRANPGTEPGEYVQITVSDNGKGMTNEQLEHIFEPFYSTKEQSKGTGLGLSMVYGFVKRSKGHINVLSEPDIGTTFHLYLPRASQPIDEKDTLSASLKDALPRGDETILVVDDEEDLRKLAEESLQLLGYHVVTASDGHQALRVLANKPVALLLSDVVMPGGMNGYELAEHAINDHPQLKILLTSGYTEKAARSKGQARFSANLLPKPYTIAELAQRIQVLLQTPAHSTDKVIKWEDTLSVGNDEIDDDHRTLISLLNRSQHATKAECGTILGQLIDYTQTHFRREEAVMAACRYPWIENHHKVHQALVTQVENMFTRFNNGRLEPDELADFLGAWLVEHIRGMDLAFAPYCKGHEEAIRDALAKINSAHG